MWADSVKIINSADLTEIKSLVLPFRQYPTYISSIIVTEPVKRKEKIPTTVNGCHCASPNLSHRDKWGKGGGKKRNPNNNYWRGWSAMHKINPINNRGEKKDFSSSPSFVNIIIMSLHMPWLEFAIEFTLSHTSALECQPYFWKEVVWLI